MRFFLARLRRKIAKCTPARCEENCAPKARPKKIGFRRGKKRKLTLTGRKIALAEKQKRKIRKEENSDASSKK